jgi:hypothetical protein
MSRSLRINVAIVAAASLVWLIAVVATSGSWSLGVYGDGFDAMVRGFTLKGGNKLTRLSPLMPTLAWLPYLVTGSVGRSFAIVNLLAFAALASAVCLLFDAHRGGWRSKTATVFVMAIVFARGIATDLASPELLATAALMVAVALAGAQWPLAESLAGVAAVMAMPVGLVAPVYAGAQAMRRRATPLVTAIVCVPALLMWIFVQWWARGGVSGARADFTPGALMRSAGVMTEAPFVTCALYLVLVAAAQAMASSQAAADARLSRRATLAAYGYAAALAALTAYFLFGVPIQLTDSFANLLDIQQRSIGQIFMAQVQNGAYFRPLLHLQLKVVYELARGDYFPWFRAVQAFQVLAALLMAVRLLRPARLSDLVVLPCALAMILGLHTFAGTITEAFPINTFLTLVLCCLAAANLAQTRGGSAIDALALLLLAFALLTLESGILVWVILAAGYAAGYRGISTRGLAALTAGLAAYFAVRLLVLHGAPPGLDERASGFGFGVLQPAELTARFGNHPLPFGVYNFVSAVMTVLFAEPRGAVWQFVRGVTRGELETWQLVNVVTSTLTTAIVAWYIARRAPSWRRRDVSEDDRVVLLFLAVLPVNALLCVVYVKDVVMSPAGVFYALAATVAIRELLIVDRSAVTRSARVWAVALLAIISTGWGWKLLGIHYSLRARAAETRAEWAYEDEWEAANRVSLATPDALALKRALIDDAMGNRKAPPQLQMPWAERAFDKTQ